ncbi:hypothetical protein [Streptomyces sp. NPDC096193]|uniref:hypothetical protein n=1 Tax=Streptomyces sp. NPDC096193 TaxID=3155821 RepID=UPI00332DF4CB
MAGSGRPAVLSDLNSGEVPDQEARRPPGDSRRRSGGHIYAILSPELFLVLTRYRAWPPAKWEQWAYDTLSSQLLVDNGL